MGGRRHQDVGHQSVPHPIAGKRSPTAGCLRAARVGNASAHAGRRGFAPAPCTSRRHRPPAGSLGRQAAETRSPMLTRAPRRPMLARSATGATSLPARGLRQGRSRGAAPGTGLQTLDNAANALEHIAWHGWLAVELGRIRRKRHQDLVDQHRQAAASVTSMSTSASLEQPTASPRPAGPPPGDAGGGGAGPVHDDESPR